MRTDFVLDALEQALYARQPDLADQHLDAWLGRWKPLAVLGVEAGNCLAQACHALHYLSAGHVIGRVEDETGLLLGVLAVNVREGLAGASDEQMCEWQPVGSEKSLAGVGTLAGRLEGVRRAVCEGARAMNTFGHRRAPQDHQDARALRQ